MFPVPQHAMDPRTREIDTQAVNDWHTSLVANEVFAGALDAGSACKDFVYLVATERLDLNSMALETADPLVAKVAAFVEAYHKLYGRPVR